MTNDPFSPHPVEKLLAVMKNLNLNALRMFDASARHLNFRRAADELHLTQGAVAQQIRALEARLGRALFRRLPRGLALTDAGRQYHTEVSRALQIVMEATEKLTEATAITLSVTPSLASKWLMPRLPQLIEIMPEVDIKIHASEQKADLMRGDVDIVIRQGPQPQIKDISVVKLSDISYVAVASPRFVDGELTLSDLLQHHLIQDSHSHWERLCSDLNLPSPKATLNVNQTALAIDAAINGQGIALAPKLLAKDAIAAGNLQVIWQDTRQTNHGFFVLYATERASEKTIQVANWLAAPSAI